MKYVQGKDRFQVEFSTQCLDETVDRDNPVRVVDAFVDSLPLEEFGFRIDYGDNGRPAYHPGDLLKLYLYGYQNRIRSSRALETECRRNIELMWLLKGLKPDHNTINRFRKDNPDAIRQVFRATVRTAQQFSLIGGELLAGDGTKLRAQNSKKNNFNHKKIERHLAYIDRKLDEYNNTLAEADGDLKKEKKKETDKRIDKHKKQRKRYEDLQQRLDEQGQEQISTSDPDSRQMIIRGQITEVAYNVQATVDDQHLLPIDYKVTNRNDSLAMGEMVERAVGIIGHNEFTALYDKGYHTTGEFEKAEKLGVSVLVAIPAVSSHAPNPMFDLENFIYNPKKDQYTCPARRVLRSNGTWYHNRDKGARFKQYKTPACTTCFFKNACTKSAVGRVIHRNENAHLVEANKKRIAENPELYKRRQAIIEHPFGTIKRQWGFDHVMTKKHLHRAEADVGLIFTAYNLKRLLNILTPDRLIEAFGGLLSLFWLRYALHKVISLVKTKCKAWTASIEEISAYLVGRVVSPIPWVVKLGL